MAQSDSKRPKDLNERVQWDIACGDLGTARLRLLSRLQRDGYSADLLARIGRLSFDMHDLANAGRYWLISNEKGPEVDAAIEQFAQRCGRIPGNMVSQLPQTFRRMPFASYPADVQERLRHNGIDENCLIHGPTQGARHWRKASADKWTNRAVWLLQTVFVLFLIVTTVVGSCTLVKWAF